MVELAYQFKPTEQFSKKFKALKAADPSGYKRISKVIERLLVNPDDADGKMHGLYNGRLKKYVGRSGYRIIYYWCELCRKENRRLKNDCEKCSEIPDHSVIFFDVYHKKDRKKYCNSYNVKQAFLKRIYLRVIEILDGWYKKLYITTRSLDKT